jgi:hypothetical protein
MHVGRAWARFFGPMVNMGRAWAIILRDLRKRPGPRPAARQAFLMMGQAWAKIPGLTVGPGRAWAEIFRVGPWSARPEARPGPRNAQVYLAQCAAGVLGAWWAKDEVTH